MVYYNMLHCGQKLVAVTNCSSAFILILLQYSFYADSERFFTRSANCPFTRGWRAFAVQRKRVWSGD